MRISNLEIFQTANLLNDLHGSAAIVEARKMASDFQEKGDRNSADVWLRIIVAIESLRTEQPAHLS
jgi:hypothetical protein